jgi:uncharacterized protein
VPVDSILEVIRRELARGPALRLAVVFGSTARGSARANSDVDLAILPADPSLSLREELELQVRLERALERSVDLVRLDGATPALRWRVARDGIVVQATPPYEAPRFLASAASEHDELAPLFEDATRRYSARVRRRGARS